MVGKTISAYTNEETARRVVELARREKRTPSQIAAEAIAFYVLLPREAHSSLRELDGADHAHVLLMVQRVTHAILRAGYDASLERVAGAARIPDAPVLGSEDAILAEAVRLTSSPSAERRSAAGEGDRTDEGTRRGK